MSSCTSEYNSDLKTENDKVSTQTNQLNESLNTKENHVSKLPNKRELLGYQKAILNDINNYYKSTNHSNNANSYCVTLCNNELDLCMSWVKSLYSAYDNCVLWVQECSNNPCPPDWCDNFQDQSDCDEYWQIIQDNMEEIANITDQCYFEWIDCVAKCKKKIGDPL